jgi:RNA polymerase-binding transcription factor DksA
MDDIDRATRHAARRQTVPGVRLCVPCKTRLERLSR